LTRGTCSLEKIREVTLVDVGSGESFAHFCVMDLADRIACGLKIKGELPLAWFQSKVLLWVGFIQLLQFEKLIFLICLCYFYFKTHGQCNHHGWSKKQQEELLFYNLASVQVTDFTLG